MLEWGVKIYRNTKQGFVDAEMDIPGLRDNVAWGDYDNDGRLDLLGKDDNATQIYRNTERGFVKIPTNLPFFSGNSAAWGDYDNDGRLDLILDNRLYRNHVESANTPPNAPGRLRNQIHAPQVELSWAASNDDQTPTPGLYYNLRVGTAPGRADIFSPMACLDRCGVSNNGYRQVVGLGNVQHRLTTTLTLPPGTYYWSVQAIDTTFAGSTFAPEASFTVPPFDILALTTTVSPPGPTMTYTLAFSNVGVITATGVVITNVLPLSLTAQAIHIDGATLTPTTFTPPTYTWQVQDLKPGQGGRLTVMMESLSTGVFTGAAEISTTAVETYTANNRVVATMSIPPFSLDPVASANLVNVNSGSIAWGDYDNDGRLDILLAGADKDGRFLTKVYQNMGGSFADAGVDLPAVLYGSVAWGDYDNDNRLDLLLTGLDEKQHPLSRVYRNTGNGFVDIDADLPGVYYSSVAWGDYDQDGRLDFLLAGLNKDQTPLTRLYRNTGSGFIEAKVDLPGVAYSSVAWGDYDQDGRLDFLLTGLDKEQRSLTRLYRNTGDNFVEIEANLPDVAYGNAAWGDADHDGDLDLLLTGYDGSAPFIQVCQNEVVNSIKEHNR